MKIAVVKDLDGNKVYVGDRIVVDGCRIVTVTSFTPSGQARAGSCCRYVKFIKAFKQNK